MNMNNDSIINMNNNNNNNNTNNNTSIDNNNDSYNHYGFLGKWFLYLTTWRFSSSSFLNFPSTIASRFSSVAVTGTGRRRTASEDMRQEIDNLRERLILLLWGGGLCLIMYSLYEMPLVPISSSSSMMLTSPVSNFNPQHSQQQLQNHMLQRFLRKHKGVQINNSPQSVDSAHTSLTDPPVVTSNKYSQPSFTVPQILQSDFDVTNNVENTPHLSTILALNPNIPTTVEENSITTNTVWQPLLEEEHQALSRLERAIPLLLI